GGWRLRMAGFATKGIFALAALGTSATLAVAQAGPEPWGLKPDKGYAYGKDGKNLAYKMGAKNAGEPLKRAKKVPKGTLFFIGANGQLYMRSGPYLEGDGSFKFGPE